MISLPKDRDGRRISPDRRKSLINKDEASKSHQGSYKNLAYIP